MTINRAQGQTLRMPGLYLPSRLLSHGHRLTHTSLTGTKTSTHNTGWEFGHVCRTHFKKMMWLSDYINDVNSPLVALLMALLTRVARDPAILTLTSDEVKGTGRTLSRHKGSGAICQGCPSCNGPNWHFKTESVAALWKMCCKPFTHVCHMNNVHTMLSVVVHSDISLSQVVIFVNDAPSAPDILPAIFNISS